MQYLYVSAGLNDSKISVDDYAYTDSFGQEQRVVQIKVGQVNLLCGGADEMPRILALSRLIDAAVKLRSASVARFEAAGGVVTDAPSDTPLGIEDDVAGEAVAS